MTDQELTTTLEQKIKEADALMRDHCAGSPDALKFGWDWPTFNVLFPDQAAEIRALKAEGRERGLDGKTYRIFRSYHPIQNRPNETIKEGLTLREAKEHCSDPSTRKVGVYCDCFAEE